MVATNDRRVFRTYGPNSSVWKRRARWHLAAYTLDATRVPLDRGRATDDRHAFAHHHPRAFEQGWPRYLASERCQNRKTRSHLTTPLVYIPLTGRADHRLVRLPGHRNETPSPKSPQGHGDGFLLFWIRDRSGTSDGTGKARTVTSNGAHRIMDIRTSGPPVTSCNSRRPLSVTPNAPAQRQ